MTISPFSATWRSDVARLIESMFGNGNLEQIANLSRTPNQAVYTDASGNFGLTALTAFARTLLDDASGGAMMATIGSVFNNAANGRLIIPVGSVNFWLQWMQLGSVDVDFIQPWPQAFPNSCLLATAATEEVPSGQNIAHYAWITEKSPTTVTVRRRTITNGGNVAGSVIAASAWGIGW